MRIKLKQAWGEYSVGTILEPHPGLAKKLIDAKIAMEVRGPKVKIARSPGEQETGEADPEAERAVTPPAKPKRKRRGAKAKAKDREGDITNGD